LTLDHRAPSGVPDLAEPASYRSANPTSRGYREAPRRATLDSVATRYQAMSIRINSRRHYHVLIITRTGKARFAALPAPFLKRRNSRSRFDYAGCLRCRAFVKHFTGAGQVADVDGFCDQSEEFAVKPAPPASRRHLISASATPSS